MQQTSRPNALSRKGRSTSPLDPSGGNNGGTSASSSNVPRSPLGAARLTTQLGSMSFNHNINTSSMSVGKGKTTLMSSPAARARTTSSLSHKKSKSTLAGTGNNSRSSDDRLIKSAKNSPTKMGHRREASTNAAAGTSTSSKTPSRQSNNITSAAAMLSKSAGPSTSAAHLIAAGGLGRMDIATNDWDIRATAASSSAGNSPQKRRPTSMSAKKYDRFIPSRENSASSATSNVEENTTNHSTRGGNSRLHTATAIDDSFEADNSRSRDGGDGGAGVNGDGFDDSPPPTPHRQHSGTQHQQQHDHTADQAHTAELSSSLGIELGRRILSFASEPPAASNEHSSLLAAYARGDAGISRGGAHQSTIAASQRRRIATTPEKVLDAPNLLDDYYLNLLDWSTTNLVAIALSESIYIWNAESGEVGLLCNLEENGGDPEEVACSVKFSEDGSYLAVGCSSGPVQIYDLSTSTRIRTMSGHATRVPSLSWSGAILSSGSRDGSIWNSDVRVAQHKVAELKGHRAEVCGLEWRKDTGLMGSSSGPAAGSAGGMGLLASGGNDNVVNVWDGRMLSAPKMVKNNHTAAVKAIAWCPWQTSLLATGGGSSDRTIHFWNTTTSARLNSLVTPSQVTSLVFNPHSREILSSHGFPDNQLSIWTYPTLSKVVDITQAHETRVLHSCINPDGTTIATASSDENLKFWKVFDLPKKSASSSSGAGGTLGAGFGGKGYMLGEGKNEHDVGRRGRTGLAIR